MKHKFDQIEIRIKKITDRTTKETFYWTYTRCGENGEEIKIIGKSKDPPPVRSYYVMVD